MKNLKSDILVFATLILLYTATNQLIGQTWQHTYGGDATFGEVVQTADGGFISIRADGAVAFKTDAQGVLEWTFSLPGNYSHQWGNSLVLLPDGNVVVTGSAHISNTPPSAFLIKLTPDGTLLWEQYYTTNGGPYLVAAIPGGGFYIGGQYSYLAKTDADGNLLWESTFHSMRGLVATADGGAVYLVNDNTTGNNNLFVRKVDGNGLLQWSKVFSGNNDLVGWQMIATSDGGFAITGFDYENNPQDYSDYFILKIDGNGDQEFLEHFATASSDAGKYIAQTQDGGYLVAGWSYLAGRIARLTKLDDFGMVVWERDYGAGEGLAVKELANGDIIMLSRGVRLNYLGADGSLYENTIMGNIAEDLNADCAFQAGEAGLAGWTVWAKGPIDNFAVTDGLGNFEIEIDTGSYIVQPQPPGFTWQPCEPSVATNLPTEPASNDLGFLMMESVPATMTTISGYVYQDLDGDCEQDPNEPALPNCPLWAADEPNWVTGNQQYLATTDADGFYSFTLPAGEYYGVGLVDINNNPICSPCGFDFFGYVDVVPVTNNIGLDCQSGPAQHMNGYVYFDENENCQLDVGENGMSGWRIAVVKQGVSDTLFIDGDDFPTGEFSVPVDTGDYTLIMTPPNYLFLPCQAIQNVQVGLGGTPPIMFGLMPLTSCPKMTVDVGTAFLRPCMESTYIVQYCSEGTVVAEDAYVEITLPPELVLNTSELPATPLANNTYSFGLGNVNPGDCGSFWLNATLDCNSDVGLTHCVEAHIYPDTICMDTMMAWDGSSVELSADCEGDSVILTISNNGWGDMSESLEFIVVEDNVLIRDSAFQLESGMATSLVVYPNGATIVLQAQQSFGHPGQSMPIIFVEGCGGDSISIGFVTQYPQNDGDCAIAIDCRESVNSFDPNIKRSPAQRHHRCSFHHTGNGFELSNHLPKPRHSACTRSSHFRYAFANVGYGHPAPRCFIT